MTYIPDSIRRFVFDRASGCCEYCRIHQDYVFASHQIDHIIAEKHRGTSTEENLCLSCLRCNLNKGSDISSIDPLTGELTPLFNPRQDIWGQHFHLDKITIMPLTAIGRVTEFLLELNSVDQLERRTNLSPDEYPC